jgi:hypothetical protein
LLQYADFTGFLEHVAGSAHFLLPFKIRESGSQRRMGIFRPYCESSSPMFHVKHEEFGYKKELFRFYLEQL